MTGSGLSQNGVLIEWARYAATALEMFGVAVILIAVVVAAVVYLRTGVSTRDWSKAYGGARANLGRGILLGLELLVGADIIATVTAPLTFESIAMLGGIVLIRTFLSFALETEIEGRWPWRRHTPERSAPDQPAQRRNKGRAGPRD
ncbi:MAG: DUF1622 domain-containing protein [Brevundimonas sp.]|uniref:DUF1622 domain-containing protein n=1 Tax=Brevundimonas sp. TaxID=1871086 RepID=UPI002632E58D|nr:DUF1622 domain-containing protein [Brevundimonas sp.]MDI6625030.1 DUF1622 domain-containing protein [Brevundimonas sp.]MDQ7813258.1 DUF1622 domain-containing protein [Brevundimonas sp.]